MVWARSAEEMPVVMPYAASTATVMAWRGRGVVAYHHWHAESVEVVAFHGYAD